MAADLDRAYIINGTDLCTTLAGTEGKPPLVPNPADVACYILGRIGKPYPPQWLMARAQTPEGAEFAVPAGTLPAPADWRPGDAGDPEIAAMGRIHDELIALGDAEAVERTLVYLADRCLGVSLRGLLEGL